MSSGELMAKIWAGDLNAVRDLLRGGVDFRRLERVGVSPLASAIDSDTAGPDMLRLLLEFGAEIGKLVTGSVLEKALQKGDPEKLRVLLSAGADLQGVDESGYDALIRAVHGRDVARDPHLVAFLGILIEHGVSLNGISKYGESGLSVLSHLARFDAVKVLLSAGADPAPLAWTPLIEATALGSLEDVQRLVREGANLQGCDRWDRTAWLVAVQMGDIDKASFLKENGSDIRARGRVGKTALLHAIESHRSDMLRWLIGIGADIEEADDFGDTPLPEAAASDDLECLNLLLKAGADPNVVPERDSGSKPETALHRARSRRIILRLLEVGADPAELSDEGRRALAGLPPVRESPCFDLPPAAFERARNRRFGRWNPEPMDEPFWIAMIRSGVSGYQGNAYFSGPSSFDAGPVWCASRFGQSITLLPDGRAVQIAGEHEDYYDPDFCIYNDVFVHHPDGTIHIYGYPKDDFPPTDFHSATLVGDWIYVIGSLGYQGQRSYGTTPVYRLDTKTFRMECLETKGECPGWIHRHRATLISPREIRIQGGEVCHQIDRDGRDGFSSNTQSFVLDLERRAWRRE